MEEQYLKFAPKFALFTSDAVHDAGYVLKSALELSPQGITVVVACPHASIVKGQRAALEQVRIINLQDRRRAIYNKRKPFNQAS